MSRSAMLKEHCEVTKCMQSLDVSLRKSADKEDKWCVKEVMSESDQFSKKGFRFVFLHIKLVVFHAWVTNS